MKYIVRIGDEEIEVRRDADSVTIDGTTTTARLEDTPGSPERVVTIGREVYRVLARRGTHKGQYDLWMVGHRFHIEALNERARAIRELSGATKAAGPAHVIAPMPGLIVRVNVAEGERVSAGQGLVVMEAMKMENELRAPVDGIVSRVAVSPGTAVEKGAILLEMADDVT